MIISGKYSIKHEIETINDMCLFCAPLINSKIHDKNSLVEILIKRYGSYGKHRSFNDLRNAEKDVKKSCEQKENLNLLYNAMIKKGAKVTNEILNLAQEQPSRYPYELLSELTKKKN